MADERDDIRVRTDIVDLVGQRVVLKRVGKHFSGLCPFHNDKHPSFTVDPSTGRYRCWSCNESGDVFTWIMKTENLSFPEAYRLLADRAGIQLKARDKNEPTQDKAQVQLAMQEALRCFRETLSKDSNALAYCDRRGIDKDSLDKWELGFASHNGEALTARLKKAGLPLSLCKDLFLVDEDGRGGFYDRFRGRLMFPIYDERGTLVAFGGRLLGDGNPKYINSSDTPIYRKSRVLYGLNVARHHLMTSRQAVLVEGYLDVIACHRSGVIGAIASLGTAFGEEHSRLLKRWCDQVSILYDSDSAGQKAAERAIPFLEAEGLRVKVALMPPGEDPDTLLQERGPAAVLDAANSAISPTAFKLVQLDRRLTPDSDEYWEEALDILVDAKEDLEREGHLLKLAGRYPQIKDPRAALNRLTKMVESRRKPVKAQGNRRERPVPISEFVPLRQPLIPAETVIFGALHEPTFQKSAWIALRMPEIFVTGIATQLAEAVLAAFPSSPPSGPALAWLGQIEPEPMRQLLSDIHLDYQNANLTEDSIIDSMNSLKTKAIDRDLRRVRQENLTSAERQEILTRIRLLKPDSRALPHDDDDPFA